MMVQRSEAPFRMAGTLGCCVYLLTNVSLAPGQSVCPVWSADPVQATANIQACIDDSNVTAVYIDNVDEGPWVVRSIHLTSAANGKTIEFGPDVLMQGDPNWPSDPNSPMTQTSCLIHGTDCEGVTLTGDPNHPARIEMLFEAGDPNNAANFWRHALRLDSCTSVTVEHLQFKSTCGDGVCVTSASGGSHVPNNDITIRHCTTYECRRDGLTVDNARGLLVEYCIFRDAVEVGDNRGRGVLLEPYDPNQVLSGVVFKYCEAIRNDGPGFAVTLSAMTADSEDVNVVFDTCRVEDSIGNGFSAGGDPDIPAGMITFTNCVCEDNSWLGAYVHLPTTHNLLVTFDHCVWRNVAIWNTCPLKLYTVVGWRGEKSGITFEQCEIHYSSHREFADIITEPEGPAEDIEGSITIFNENAVVIPSWRIPNLSVTYCSDP